MSAGCVTQPPGGPECVFPDANGQVNHGYEMCLETVRKSLVTATAASSMFGCLLMGFFANLPIATAPGMGLNAYFAYTVVGYRGSGPVGTVFNEPCCWLSFLLPPFLPPLPHRPHPFCL